MNRYSILILTAMLLAWPVGSEPLSAGSEVKTQCKVAPEIIGAEYLVTEKFESKDKKVQKKEKHFALWRRGKEVAHEYRETHITEIWNLVSNGQLRPVRYFDEHKRAIEYQPGDVIRGAGKAVWSEKYQLIADDALRGMSLTHTVGVGCERIETYVRETDGARIELAWMPAYKLVKQYTVAKKQASVNWTLIRRVEDKKLVDAQFKKREGYQTTDYADIGDSESDPFLRKMINLGFIEHGAVGFYHAQGHTLGAEHHH